MIPMLDISTLCMQQQTTWNICTLRQVTMLFYLCNVQLVDIFSRPLSTLHFCWSIFCLQNQILLSSSSNHQPVITIQQQLSLSNTSYHYLTLVITIYYLSLVITLQHEWRWRHDCSERRLCGSINTTTTLHHSHHARAEDPRMDGPLPLLQPETRIKIPSPSRVGSSLARVACLLSEELYTSGYWYSRANQSTVS